MNRVQTRKKKYGSSSEKWMGKKIGIIIPTTTKGLEKISSLDELPFFRIMLPSFIDAAWGKCVYNFYLGYDHDDKFFKDDKVDEQIIVLFDKLVRKKSGEYSLEVIRFPHEIEKGDLSTMWSHLANIAMDRGNEYIYQLGDDIIFTNDSNWEIIFMSKLEIMNNIGVTGPSDRGKKILTQSFVHCTHLSIFKRYFPIELKNWYIDDWLTEVYSSHPLQNVKVKNMSNDRVRYSIKNMEQEKNQCVQRDRKTINSLRTPKNRKIIYIKSDKNFIYLEDKYLVIVNSNLTSYHLEINSITSKGLNEILKHINSPQISFRYEDKLYHRQGNYLNITIEEIPIVKNIENEEIEENTDDIYLIQQFFIPDKPERYSEIKDTLRRNVKLGIFKKIYLLNEKIYTEKELGITHQSIVQINIGKRMSYADFFYHTKHLRGFLVLSNSDIFFDKTISNLRKNVLREIKGVQCLRRYEYRGEKNLDDCKLYSNYESSQDCWIIHNKHMPVKTDKYDFYLGIPGCENTFSNILRLDGYTLLNNYYSLRSYHNHKTNYRNYNGQRINRRLSHVLCSHPIFPTQEVTEKYDLFWQYPVVTEKKFYEQNKSDPDFIGIPWATIIDKKLEIDTGFLLKNVYDRTYYTCCQHIRFRNIIPLLKTIGIRILYTPHKIIGEDIIDGIIIKPCPLYAKVIEDGRKKPVKEASRKYLYSFKGGYQKGYMSNIRLDIFNIKHPYNTFIQNTGQWHFNQIVYTEQQNKDGKYNGDEHHYEKEKDYTSLLYNSRYTLCPSGTGPNSIRFWEALGAGSIPVLLSDKLELPPHELWKDTIIRVREDHVSAIRNILTKIPADKEEEMRKNCYKIYEFFRNNYKGQHDIKR